MIYADCASPTCSEFKLINTKDKKPGVGNCVQSPAIAHFGAVSDDVPWDKYEYRVLIDGNERHESLHNDFKVAMSEGRHAVWWNLTDGCNRSQGFRILEVIVDNTAPSVSISEPVANATTLLSPLNVVVFAGDRLSGIHHVKLYVDQIDATPEAEFRGPWIKDMLSKSNASVSIQKSGEHVLIVVAQDRAGNTAMVSRKINISSGAMKMNI